MAKQTINIGSGELTGDGESLRSAFDKINDNFDEVYAGSGTTLDSDTSPALGGNLDLSGNDITGIGNLNITGNITATGSINASLAYSNLTSTPTTLAGYGITDAYTQTQVDTAITNATSSIVIQSGSTHSIDIVAADSTVLVDSVNGTLNATTLTGALPAIDGSNLTNLTIPAQTFTSLTGKPTTLAGYGITDAQDALVSGTNIKTINGESLLGSGNITITGGSGGGSAFTNIGVGADDSTIRSIGEGESFLILGGTGVTTASDAEGNITITGFDGAFSSLSGTPTTLSGYGITDALTAGGALTGSSLEAVAVGAGVADGNDLAISGGDATELNSTGGDANITGGSGALAPGNVNIGASQTALVTIGSGSNNVDFPNGTAVDFTGTTVTGLDFYTDGDVDTHLNQSTAGTNEVLSWDGADYAWVAQSGGGSGLQSRGTVTGTTSSLADAAEADLDITGFKSYALLSITTDRAARVRLYVTDATRTADASRAEGVDPTSDAGLIAEVITTGAETVIISPGAFGFNLEGTPTTTIPCRVTNKSGGTSTVQVDLNILQLEA